MRTFGLPLRQLMQLASALEAHEVERAPAPAQRIQVLHLSPVRVLEPWLCREMDVPERRGWLRVDVTPLRRGRRGRYSSFGHPGGIVALPPERELRRDFFLEGDEPWR